MGVQIPIGKDTFGGHVWPNAQCLLLKYGEMACTLIGKVYITTNYIVCVVTMRPLAKLLWTLVELIRCDATLNVAAHDLLQRHWIGCLVQVGRMENESVPIQLAQCRFPGLAISNAKI